MRAAEEGLQPQRTSLAWTRTSLAVLANGAVLMVHDIAHHRAGFGLVAAGVAALVAALTYLIGLRRQRLLASEPLPVAITPRAEVMTVTAAVVALIVVSIAALVIQ